jgi:putative transcriptional regulator
MNDELFAELIASVREGGAILRGEAEPSRTFSPPPPDVKRIREGYKLSQAQFAAFMGISVGTLRNWEQGRRAPEGPARVLLRVAERHPKAVWDVVRPVLRKTLLPPCCPHTPGQSRGFTQAFSHQVTMRCFTDTFRQTRG